MKTSVVFYYVLFNLSIWLHPANSRQVLDYVIKNNDSININKARGPHFHLLNTADNHSQKGMCTCLSFDIIDGTPTTFMVPNPGSCASLIGQEINGYYIDNAYTVLYIQATSFETDGFVLAESTAAMPNPTREPIRMQGSGHFQMRNDSNLGFEFDNMFRDNLYGKFWKLY